MTGGSWQNNPRENHPAQERRREPMFNLPQIIVWALALLWIIHLGRDWLLTRQQDLMVIIQGGFIPLRYAIDAADQGLAWVWTPVTYSLLHDGFTHLIVNSIFLMAFASLVARRIGTGRFLILWLFSAVASAAVYGLVNQHSNIPMIGASGVISAMMGAAARFAFPKNGRFNRLNGHLLPLQSLQEALSNKTVLVWVAVWFGISALTALGLHAGVDVEAQIAWEAHLGGFVFGFLLFPLFDRPVHT